MNRPLAYLLASTAFIPGISAQAQQQGVTQLDEIVVQNEAARQDGTRGAAGVISNDGYVARTTRSATKTDTPVIETPQTISTVTQRQLAERKPQTLTEALGYTPGARIGGYGFDPRFDSFSIRGVDITYTGVFRDGMREFNSPSGLFRTEPYGLDSISILKGPASSLYGASASVGVIDMISKRPTEYRFGEIEVQGGSFNRKQLNFDLGGPVNEAGTVLYRVTGVLRGAHTNLPGVPDNRTYIAPAITFKPNDSTKLTILGEYMDSKTGGSAAYDNTYGTFSLRDGTVIFPTTGATRTLLFNPAYNDFTQKQGRIGYEFEHKFNEAVSFHQNLRWSTLSTDEKFGGTTYAGQVKENLDALTADTYLKTLLRTGPVEHTILTGFDIGHASYGSRIGYNFAAIANPVLPYPTKQDQTLIGAYVQDEIKAGPWRLLLSGRHDWLQSSYRVPGAAADKQDKGAFTGRLGLSYVTDFGLTPYASYGTSFNANPGTVLNGGVAKPTRGEQAEVGVKYALPGYNTLLNASAFWLKQEDGIVYTVVNGFNQQTQLDFRSRGFELEANTSLGNGISFQASYAYTDTRILKLSPDTVGNQVNSVPRHAFSLWGGYDVATGPLRGLGFGAGVRYTGVNFGDDYNRLVIRNKATAFVDARLTYDFEKLDPKLKGLTAQVNAQNLLNKVDQVCTAGYCYFNQGRKVIASLKYRW
ncbi:MAG: TonB-dependent siderophore receptor [Bosea sp. (in: a-proteobacteria)]|uniref:TonB-dependent siderophore receptor n=1 Tax=Bosea sp. (in: a-proteobacteria) TaxID=1871050 RepID=UPI003F7B7966